MQSIEPKLWKKARQNSESDERKVASREVCITTALTLSADLQLTKPKEPRSAVATEKLGSRHRARTGVIGTERTQPPNENKISDGGRERVSLAVKVWKSSQKENAVRSAVRCIAWLGVARGSTLEVNPTDSGIPVL